MHSVNITISLTTAIGTTPNIPYGSYYYGTIHIPSGSNITTLTWHESDQNNGTYEAAYDSSASAVTQTVAAGRAYPIPTALQGARALKCVVNSAGLVRLSLKGG
jgi:hypothetical protein